MSIPDTPNNVLTDATGNAPEVSDSLEVKNRTISSVDQAFQVCETLINDWKKGILNATRITAKINGERPYNQAKLKNAGKDWKTNVSTGFLATECNKVMPRLYMPIKTAKYLTAASLPPGWPDGAKKTEFFRQAITETLRSWPKFNFYLRGLAREVTLFGFAFNAFFDEWEWRPTLMRMDKGFVPQGTEVMDTEPAFFLAKYDYRPSELLDLLKSSVDAGRDEWKKDNVVRAIDGAMPPPQDSSYPEARVYEDLIRQATWGFSYTKGAKVVRTYHLFAKETTGKVSHYIVWVDGGPANPGDASSTSKLLYENLDQFDSMEDVANSMVFDYGDGSIHGVWGAGQILYDLAVQVEKIRCDSMDNMRMSNKLKIQVNEGKNVNDVKQVINDTMVIISGAQMAGNMAGITQDIEGYELLDAKLSRVAQEKIGSYVPPIPLQPSDIKAAQINAAVSKEKELQEALLENWLIQWAMVMKTIQKRLVKKGNPDEIAKGLRKVLLTQLTEEEIDLMAAQFPVQSVMDFTEYKARERGAFAASVMGNALFNQTAAARIMAGGVGDERFIEEITVPTGDNSDQIKALHDQLLENASMALGQNTPVLKTDNDWLHMQALKPALMSQLQGGNIQLSQIGLQHYAAHYAQGVGKKTIPKENINSEKQFIAASEKLIAEHMKQQQIAQATQQATEQAGAQAAQIVQQEQQQGQGIPQQ